MTYKQNNLSTSDFFLQRAAMLQVTYPLLIGASLHTFCLIAPQR